MVNPFSMEFNKGGRDYRLYVCKNLELCEGVFAHVTTQDSHNEFIGVPTLLPDDKFDIIDEFIDVSVALLERECAK